MRTLVQPIGLFVSRLCTVGANFSLGLALVSLFEADKSFSIAASLFLFFVFLNWTSYALSVKIDRSIRWQSIEKLREQLVYYENLFHRPSIAESKSKSMAVASVLHFSHIISHGSVVATSSLMMSLFRPTFGMILVFFLTCLMGVYLFTNIRNKLSSLIKSKYYIIISTTLQSIYFMSFALSFLIPEAKIININIPSSAMLLASLFLVRQSSASIGSCTRHLHSVLKS